MTIQIKIDKWTFFSLVLIIVGVSLLTFYFYTDKVNECTSDPLRFTLEKVRDSTNAESIYGSIFVDGRKYNFDLSEQSSLQDINISINISS